MKKYRSYVLRILLLSFFIFSAADYALAKDEKSAVQQTEKVEQKVKPVDLVVTEVNIPEKIYLNKKVSITIVIFNNSDQDLEGCTLTAQATDGSQTSQTFPFAKESREKVELKWVPLKSGKIEFKVTLAGPKNIQESNTKNNQFVKEIDVIAPPPAKTK